MTRQTLDLRSSQEWSQALEVTVLDPDGWDRRDLERSWSEPITRDEFLARLAASTIRWNVTA